LVQAVPIGAGLYAHLPVVQVATWQSVLVQLPQEAPPPWPPDPLEETGVPCMALQLHSELATRTMPIKHLVQTRAGILMNLPDKPSQAPCPVRQPPA
jgi:hypothetical protein